MPAPRSRHLAFFRDFSGLLCQNCTPGWTKLRLWVTLLFLTKQQWGDVHFWIAVVAIIVTVIHIAADWRALRGCIRYLSSIERSPVACR